MKLEHGVPSHDTIGRVFGLIAPDEFDRLPALAGMVVPALAADTVVAIDGKTSRRSGGKGKTDASPLHLVSAFAAGMSCWARRRPPKSNRNHRDSRVARQDGDRGLRGDDRRWAPDEDRPHDPASGALRAVREGTIRTCTIRSCLPTSIREGR